MSRNLHVIRNATLGFAMLAFAASIRTAPAAQFNISWRDEPERYWPCPEMWTNRLQDWRVADGALRCTEKTAAKPMRTAHLLTHTLSSKRDEFELQVRLGLVDPNAQVARDAAAGFLIGAGQGLDYRAAALIHHSPGPNGGIFAGISAEGGVFFQDFSKAKNIGDRKNVSPMLAGPVGSAEKASDVLLKLKATPIEGGCSLLLSAVDSTTGEEMARVTLADVDSRRLTGHIALVSHPGSGRAGGSFWFSDFVGQGKRIAVHTGRECGPFLSAQYTVHGNVLKLTAQMMPVGRAKNRTVVLETQQGGLLSKNKMHAESSIFVPGWTATFRIDNWDASQDATYRLSYTMDSSGKEYTYEGLIRKDPVDKNPIVVAAFTGNHNTRRGVDSGRYSWTMDHLWFPHEEIVRHVSVHKPDLLFFSGDNVYEGASPTAADRSGGESSYYDYLYKWYLWCWAFRDLTRDTPCVAIPDDHDVYQGNLWGAGGRATDKDDKGGYVLPAEWVRMVERTQTSNLPDPYDPTPIEQNIGVYYTALNLGHVSFAILEDRKFKSGPNGLCPPTKTGRADHVNDPSFDPKTADVPGAKLLGDRQLDFVRHWATDWRGGVEMKATLSQTVFAGLATNHGADLMRLLIDYDSNGWPQTGRNKALREFRRCFAFMIGGDQHLATLVHHGIDNWNDAGWSFAVPSIANFYLRAWRPEIEGRNHQPGMPSYTGEYLDGLGNPVTVWAATNPGESMGHEPAALHDKKPGYGIIRFDKQKRDIIVECWPRFADPKKDKQYLGWPKTIDQFDNYGRTPRVWMPEIKVEGIVNPVVQLIDEADGQIVYTVRIRGTEFRPWVFKEGKYTIRVSDPDAGLEKTLEHVQTYPEVIMTVPVTILETLTVRF